MERVTTQTAGRAHTASGADLQAEGAVWDDLFGRLQTTPAHSAASAAGPAGDAHLQALRWGEALGRLILQNPALSAQITAAGETGLFSFHLPPAMRWVYQMYAQFGAVPGPLLAVAAPLSGLAAHRADGALTVMLINPTPAPISTALGVSQPPAAAWLFDRAHPAAAMAPPGLSAGRLTVPAAAMLLLVFPAP